MAMRMVLVVSILCATVLAGCGGVWMNAEYSRLVDETAALSAETARRAEGRELDPNQMAAALRAQACVWGKLVDARDGKAPGETK